jgi:hypothetical protein
LTSTEPGCAGCGHTIAMTGAPPAWRVSATDPDVLRFYDTASCEASPDGRHRPSDLPPSYGTDGVPLPGEHAFPLHLTAELPGMTAWGILPGEYYPVPGAGTSPEDAGVARALSAAMFASGHRKAAVHVNDRHGRTWRSVQPPGSAHRPPQPGDPDPAEAGPWRGYAEPLPYKVRELPGGFIAQVGFADEDPAGGWVWAIADRFTGGNPPVCGDGSPASGVAEDEAAAEAAVTAWEQQHTTPGEDTRWTAADFTAPPAGHNPDADTDATIRFLTRLGTRGPGSPPPLSRWLARRGLLLIDDDTAEPLPAGQADDLGVRYAGQVLTVALRTAAEGLHLAVTRGTKPWDPDRTAAAVRQWLAAFGIHDNPPAPAAGQDPLPGTSPEGDPA